MLAAIALSPIPTNSLPAVSQPDVTEIQETDLTPWNSHLPTTSVPPDYEFEEDTLADLYIQLKSLASYLVNLQPLPFWRGHEADIADDIVQETMHRLLERQQKFLRGDATPILSLRNMASTIASNFYRDLKRRERRLNRLDIPDPSLHEQMDNDIFQLERYEVIDMDHVINEVDNAATFVVLACEIQQFPQKQRSALLTDLANLMCFDTEPTALQSAFHRVGIEMQDYQQKLPDEFRARTRHISSLSQAYKRLKKLHEHDLE